MCYAQIKTSLESNGLGKKLIWNPKTLIYLFSVLSAGRPVFLIQVLSLLIMAFFPEFFTDLLFLYDVYCGVYWMLSWNSFWYEQKTEEKERKTERENQRKEKKEQKERERNDKHIPKNISTTISTVTSSHMHLKFTPICEVTTFWRLLCINLSTHPFFIAWSSKMQGFLLY